MSDIICPVCGKTNPETLEVCQLCGAALKHSPAEASDQSGLSTTPHDADSDALEDLLAGLSGLDKQDDKDIPEWLKNLQNSLTSSAPAEAAASPEPTPIQEQQDEQPGLFTDRPDSKDNSGAFTFDAETEPASNEPQNANDWLNALMARDEQNKLPGQTPVSGQPASSDFSDWLSNPPGTSSQPEAILTEPEPESEAEKTAWPSIPADLPTGETLASETSNPEPASQPDWFSIPGDSTSSSGVNAGTSANEAPLPTVNADLPDWLAALKNSAPTPDVPTVESAPETPASSGEGNVPEWLASISEPVPGETEPAQAPAPEASAADATRALPDWLAAVNAPVPTPSETDGESSADAPTPTAAGDLPDWLAALQGSAPTADETAKGPAPETPAAVVPATIPGWLESLQNAAETPADSSENSTPEIPGGNLTDWLSTLGSIPVEATNTSTTSAQPESIQPGADTVQPEQNPPELETNIEGEAGPKPTDEAPTTETEDLIPAAADEQSIDSMLSLDKSDWLEGIPLQPIEKEPEPAAESPQQPGLPEGELPSWVQAMRPVESVIAGTQAEDETDEWEDQGPLAGLRSVLPIQPGAVGSSAAGTYSTGVLANENQMTQAALLDDLLSSESKARVESKSPEKLKNRPMRWIIAAVLLVAVLVSAALGTDIFPTPPLPLESSPVGMFKKVIESLPEESPVLVVLDYQPGFAAELESAAGPVMDHLMSKDARLAFVSTTPLGGMLADRLLQKFADIHPYKEGLQYVNLGYLPGDANGIKAFADQPGTTLGQDALGGNLWDQPALAGVSAVSEPRLSNFAAIIVATDNPDTGRLWIEQTQPALGSTPMLMILSTQAEPMIRPYLVSHQLNGLVTGLEGGLLYESAQGKSGQARSYWDTFGVAVLAAVLLILFGGAWNLVSGLSARRTAKKKGKA